jgi:hypothetical protein
MPHMIFRFRFLSIAALATRLVALVAGVAMAVLLASPGPRLVNAQQTVPASTPDNQPAAAQAPPAQPPASDQAPQAAPPPPPATTPETSPAPPAENQPPVPGPNNAQPPLPQQPATDQSPQPTPAPPDETQSSPAPAASPSTPAPKSQPAHTAEPNEITEEEIKSLLVGKQLFLRGGYLDNDLSYNEHGALVSHSPQGSYTLSAVQIDKVHLGKHKLELEGERYGLHFLGALPYEDPTKAVDRVNITPKKKVVKISIDRELVVKPKEKKEKPEKGTAASPAPKAAAAPAPTTVSAPNATAPASAAATTPPAETASATDNQEAHAEIAAAPAAEGPADAKSVTTTTSQAHSNKMLSDALDNVFAQPFDSRMMDSMPGFWKLYYVAAAAKTDYKPADPAVLRQSEVDKKARLTSTFEPQSNEFAQDHGVAGICLYHVVIGADGKPGEIAVARPIGFGLDENAVDSIRKATFEPAIKNGNPVPVMLDLVVEFRIYSNRTAVTGDPSQQPASPSLPGPYSTQQPQSAH